ncbi:response regulator receiver protein [Spirosoma sp. HMF4905]|uniref:Response regulator receiver protein n=1 Tax=Spirosoma arboris TaxID=2682092 RepID=A0A7K1SQU3_9BACT|nr:LytTR family DNA-binding domain-containing protein [Spirosoma arboris]MVM35966.1 response regulator receiver protein [Spirosoma arboris]
MIYYLKHQPAEVVDLLAWPPLRVYNNATGAQWLSIADLIYLEGVANYTWLHWADGRRVLIPYTLKRLESQLPDAWFLRLHRQYLVNRQFIERVELTIDKPQIQLITGLYLPISRRRWVLLRQHLCLQKP